MVISLEDPDLPAGYKRMDENKTQCSAPSKVTECGGVGSRSECFIFNKLKDFTGFAENMELNKLNIYTKVVVFFVFFSWTLLLSGVLAVLAVSCITWINEGALLKGH